MIWVPLLFLSIVLFELFVGLRMGRNARTILVTSQDAMRVLASPELPDEEKERRMRRGSFAILKATIGLAGKFVLAGVILVALFELIVRVFPALRRPLLESLVSPVILLMLTVAMLAYAWLRKAALRAL